MTSVRERVTVTYQMVGTEAEVGSRVAALRRRGQLVAGAVRRREADDRLVVEVTVRGRHRPDRGVRRIAVAIGVAFPGAGVAGHLAGVAGAELIGQVLAAGGSVAAVGLLLYAVAEVSHRRHCPGCPDH